MSGLDDLLAVLDLDDAGEGRCRASSVPVGGGTVVFGGQLLAQSLVAASRAVPGKEVASIHTVFARGGRLDEPLDIEVDVVQHGRTFGTVAVAVSQAGKRCTQSTVLLTAPDPDLVRHQPDAPEVGTPDDATASGHGVDWWDVRVAGGVDLRDPDAAGPPTLDVWTRFPGAPDDVLTSQALLAFATDGFMIGTSLRPHAGISQAGAHREFSSTVVTHTVRFHEPFSAADWLLLHHEARYAGRGRIAGWAEVFTADGRLVASFTQESMVRAFPDGQAPGAGQRAAH